jgi:hypothetical protein
MQCEPKRQLPNIKTGAASHLLLSKLTLCVTKLDAQSKERNTVPAGTIRSEIKVNTASRHRIDVLLSGVYLCARRAKQDRRFLACSPTRMQRTKSPLGTHRHFTFWGCVALRLEQTLSRSSAQQKVKMLLAPGCIQIRADSVRGLSKAIIVYKPHS